MPQFAGLAIGDTWAAAGGTLRREIARHALASCRAQFTVENPDQNRLDFGVRRNWTGLSDLTPRGVVRLTKSDGSFDEWCLNTNDVAVLGNGVKQFSALPPIYMLAECGEYYTVGSGGVRDYSYAELGVSATEGLTTLVLGTPDIPGFVGLGTVDAAVDAVLIDVESTDEGKTPLAIAYQIRDLVRAKGVPCELDFRRVGTSGYVIDLVTQVGASATVPEFAAGKNLVDYLLKYNCTRQTTRVRPKGPTDATGLAARLSRARYKVTAVNGGTKRVTLADEAGGAGPIQFDEQLVGWYAFREKTGRTFQILHSYKTTQEIELADVSTMAAHSVTAPEWISLRQTDAQNATDRVWGQGSSRKAYWWEVTAVNGGTKELTLANYWNLIDPVQANHQHVDWTARRGTFVLATSCTTSNATPGRLVCTSVAGVAVDDWVVLGQNAATPYNLYWNPGSDFMVVTGVDAVNKYLYVAPVFSGSTSTFPSGTGYPRIYRPVATRHLVTDSTAASDLLKVDALGTAAANDLVLTIAQPCRGELPTYIDSPADRAAYGTKISTLNVDAGGECNLVANAVQRAWTGGAGSAPDGHVWTQSGAGGAAVISRNTDPLYFLQGDCSAFCAFAYPGLKNGTLLSPLGPVWPIVGAEIASARVRILFSVFSAGATLSVKLVKVDHAGTVTALATATALDPTATGGVALNAWVDVTVSASIAALENERLAVEISANVGFGVSGYVDGIQITQTPAAPRAYPAQLIEYAEGTKLVQRANAELLQWAAPPKEYTAKAADFARVDPARHAADEITLGGNVRLFHAEESVDETVRCLALNVNYLDNADSDLTIAVLPPRFTSLVSLGSAAA